MAFGPWTTGWTQRLGPGANRPEPKAWPLALALVLSPSRPEAKTNCSGRIGQGLALALAVGPKWRSVKIINLLDSCVIVFRISSSITKAWDTCVWTYSTQLASFQICHRLPAWRWRHVGPKLVFHKKEQRFRPLLKLVMSFW